MNSLQIMLVFCLVFVCSAQDGFYDDPANRGIFYPNHPKGFWDLIKNVTKRSSDLDKSKHFLIHLYQY